LVSRRGRIFKRLPGGGFADLPRLEGPRGRVAKILERHRRVAEALGDGHRITRMRTSRRGAWMARVDGAVTLRFGSHRFGDRLHRLAAIQAEWDLLGRAVRRVDLRYPDGLAVAVAKDGKTDSDGARL
jgi:cell division septal protein FtsQ